MVQQQKYNRGQLLVELIVALAISAILIPAVVAGFVASRQGVAQEKQRLEATARAKESSEVLGVIRDRDWALVAANGIYHTDIVNGEWSLILGETTINGYTQSVTIGDSTPLDPSKKLITVSVSWGTPIASAVTNEFYLTRLANQSWVQTTQTEFDEGTKIGVIITNTSGGEVTLGAGGKGDWCSPNLTITAVDLPKSGVANAISAIEGKVFAGTGNNASGVSYATTLIDNADPPNATVSGTFDGYKTNGIFGEAGYAYLGTDNNAKEIEIVNLGTNPYAEAGYFNAPGNGNGNSIYVSGSVGYMTSANKLYTFDLSSKSGSRTQLGVATLAGTGVKIVVVGTYAYVAINSASTQMQIVDVSNAVSPTVVASVALNAGIGTDVVINSTGTRAYLSTAYVSGKPEFFIINTTTKSGTLGYIGSYSTDGMSPKAVTVVPGNKAIIVGTGGAQQYIAIDIADETSPVHCTSYGRSGGLAVSTGVNGIASVIEADGDTFSYIITGDASTELKIIQGGPGGAFATSGTFESRVFDASVSSAFNRFTVGSVLPVGSSISYFVSGANPVGGSCSAAQFSYMGPYATSSAIPLSIGPGYINPARCFRYKATFTTVDTFSAPIMTDMTVNYSP